MPPLKLIFAGTPEFAVPPLKALLEAGHQVIAVYTQPDRPAGRGRRLTASPVKQTALANGLRVFQPETLRGPAAAESLRELGADLMVVVAYGLLLPQAVLDAPRLGCVNVHASLLPRWRGAAPIQRAIMAGDPETGITVMGMEAGLDTGPMYLKRSLPIAPRETGGSLHDKLSALGAAALRAAAAACASRFACSARRAFSASASARFCASSSAAARASSASRAARSASIFAASAAASRRSTAGL